MATRGNCPHHGGEGGGSRQGLGGGEGGQVGQGEAPPDTEQSCPLLSPSTHPSACGHKHQCCPLSLKAAGLSGPSVLAAGMWAVPENARLTLP